MKHNTSDLSTDDTSEAPGFWPDAATALCVKPQGGVCGCLSGVSLCVGGGF